MKRSLSIQQVVFCAFVSFTSGIYAQQALPEPTITNSAFAPQISVPFPLKTSSPTQKVYDMPRSDGGVTTIIHTWSSPSHAPGTYMGVDSIRLSPEATSARKFVGGNTEAEIWLNLGVVVAGVTAEAYKANEPAIKAGLVDLGKKMDSATEVIKQTYNDTAAATDRAATTIKENWQAASNSKAVKTTAEIAKSVADEISKASTEVSKALTQDTIVKQKAVEYWQALFGK